MKPYSKQTIMPFVVLYRGLFDNSEEILDSIKNSEEILDSIKNSEKTKVLTEWEPWYDLGQRTRFQLIPLEERTEKEADHIRLHDQIESALVGAYKDYISEWTKPEVILKYENPNITFHEDWRYVFGDFVKDWDIENLVEGNDQDGWIKSPIEILKHDHLAGRNLELAIGYHLDAFNSKDAAGPKSIITGTVYLNDDYEGGEISFLNEFDNTIISYKPKKGDLIVFPSAKPFFHAAQKIENKDKYLIRNFVLWRHSGSQRYKDNEAKFGKEQWQVMQDYIRETEDLLGLYQKDVYLPGVSVYERPNGNGIPFFPKSIETWEG